MAGNEALALDKPSNDCCNALKIKHTKLLEKFSKVEELKNKFRDCTTLLQKRYDAIEKENANLKNALDELKVQANMWKDEKEKESGIRIDLEDEVLALKDDIQLLKQNGNSGSQEANEQLQERLNVADKEIMRLKELLDKERKKAAAEKKNTELEKKKADEALRQLEMDKNKVSEVQKIANVERKRADENKILWEKLKKETDELKSKLALEKSKSESAHKQVADEALKKLEMEKNKVSEAQKMANVERKRADENKVLWEKLKKETDTLKSKLALEKSKSESAQKQVEAEKQNTIREGERADLAVARAEEQQQLAETNMKKAMFEKDRADDLNQKFKDASNKVKKLEEKLQGHSGSGKSVEAQNGASNTAGTLELGSAISGEMLKKDSIMSQWMENMLLEKEQSIIREKKRADSEKKVAKKQTKVSNDLRKMASEQKHRADELSRELGSSKLRIEELQTELVKSYSYRMCADNPSLRYASTVSETDMVKKLKNQLKLEKTLVKHAKRASEVEAMRNSMLQQELVQLKKEFLQFQLRFDLLNNSFLHSNGGIQQLVEIGNDTSMKETLCSDDCHEQPISGINSGLDPPHRGSNQIMLQSSAINSSSASFSDRPLVGSQERRTLPVASTKLGDEISKLEPNASRMSAKMRIRHNERAVVEVDNATKSLVKENVNKRRIGSHERKRLLDAVKSIENLYCKGEKLRQKVSKELSLLHGILDDQKDEGEEENQKENSCQDLIRPFKRRRTSSEGTIVTHCMQGHEEVQINLDSDIGLSTLCPAVLPRGIDAMKFDAHIKDGINGSFANQPIECQYFDMMASCDYMKFLDLDNPADEISYLRAIAMPLSPLPHDLEPLVDENLEADNPPLLPDKISQELSASARDNLEPSSSFCDIASVNKSINTAISSQSHANEDSSYFLRSTNSAPACDADVHQIQVSGGKLITTDLSGSGSKEASVLCERANNTPPGGLLKHYIVCPNNRDNHSISRVLQTINSFNPCPSLDSAEIFAQSILRALLMAQELSMKEKVCVFFSIVLHGISEAGTKNWSNVLSYDLIQSVASVAFRLFSALIDPVLRRKFMESCDLFELLALIEDFLLQRKVLVSVDASSEPNDFSISKVDLVLNGEVVMLSEVVASAPLLVVGGSILASLCFAVDHIGFVCEVSCNIIMMQKCDPEVMLAVLHTFAYVCGSKYFALQQYSSAATVLKALVLFLEKKCLSTNSSIGNQSHIWLSCTNCPFSKGAVPMEDVPLMLLKNLHKQTQSVSWPQEAFEVMNSVFLKKPVLSSLVYDENMCEFVDILSLMEILASVMSWKWTADHIICEICKFLESHLVEGFSAAIVILLGQLGRQGVDAGGYDDLEVKKLREWLSALISETSFTKFSLAAQFAIVTSFFTLTPIKLEDVVNDKVESPTLSLPVGLIRKWFFVLSHEQQLFLRHSSSDSLQV